MPVNAEIWTERDHWQGSVVWSVVLHAVLLGAIIGYGVMIGRSRGDEWGGSGGGGGAMGATLVASIPLPGNPEGTNVVANESKGLTESQPKPDEQPVPDAIPIPSRQAKRVTTGQQQTPSASQQHKPLPGRTQTAGNVVPFGQGGPLSGPYSVFNAGGAKGGFGFNGGGGGFGSRYSWYVDIVRRKVSENWMKYEVDPHVSSTRRVYITFDILRNGQPANIQVEQSSGAYSLDQSAVRALQRIDSFGPLPGDYSGNRVSVEFWFDFRR
ncbi:MAG TPA: TonB family protein [Armatimonadota bacterium]|nr:TonB family protein [Armatimonadota bacterium]